MEKSGPGHQTPAVQSKVREYILDMKRSDELNRKRERRKEGCSLEDLFQVETIEQDLPPAKAKEELRKTLRKVKEKDLVILRLRETCHELTLKCAHAENTIDQLRFGRGGGMRKAASMMTLAKEEPRTTPKDTRDQATEMETRVDILDESCSNWMEKVQNWKTGESGVLATSCADADSGFRGSELLETSGRRRTVGGTKSSWKGVPLQTSVESSPTSRHNFQTTGTNTEGEGTRSHDLLEERIPRASHSQSFNDFLSHKSDKSLDKVDSSHVRTDHFKTLDSLLDETTVFARRIQKKSKKLAKLIQCVDRKT